MKAGTGPRPSKATVPWLSTIETTVPVAPAAVAALIAENVGVTVVWVAGTAISVSKKTSGQGGTPSHPASTIEPDSATAKPRTREDDREDDRENDNCPQPVRAEPSPAGSDRRVVGSPSM